MAKVKKSPEAEMPSCPGWMVTYGDMMSLLLCFFVLLLSFANLDVVKFKEAAGSLRGALGILTHEPDSGKAAIIEPLSPKLAELSQRLEARLQTIKHILRRKSVGNLVEAESQRSGIRFRIENSVLFDEGQYVLKPAAYEVLGPVADSLNKWDDDVRIDGHSDSTPYPPNAQGLIRDNMWLSVARANAVREAFANRFGVNPKRMSIMGYGPYRPLDPRETEEAKAKNRRVEVWLLATEVEDTESRFTKHTLQIPMDWRIPPLESWEIQER